MNQLIKVDADYTSSGVRGHFPSIRFAPGFITLPFLLNFPLHPFSRAISISCFSSSPPSYSQHEKATISLCKNEVSDLCHLRLCVLILCTTVVRKGRRNTFSNRRCTDTYLPPPSELLLIILWTILSARTLIGSANLSASKLAKHLRPCTVEGTAFANLLEKGAMRTAL